MSASNSRNASIPIQSHRLAGREIEQRLAQHRRFRRAMQLGQSIEPRLLHGIERHDNLRPTHATTNSRTWFGVNPIPHDVRSLTQAAQAT